MSSLWCRRRFHYDIYVKMPKTKAILHAHPTYCTAVRPSQTIIQLGPQLGSQKSQPETPWRRGEHSQLQMDLSCSEIDRQIDALLAWVLQPYVWGWCASNSFPRRILGEIISRILIQSFSNGHLSALDSDAALNAAWARRAGTISHLPRSARAGGCAEP